jgi:hypothetical protein
MANDHHRRYRRSGYRWHAAQGRWQTAGGEVGPTRDGGFLALNAPCSMTTGGATRNRHVLSGSRQKR